jgi:hypothetical protein
LFQTINETKEKEKMAEANALTVDNATISNSAEVRIQSFVYCRQTLINICVVNLEAS